MEKKHYLVGFMCFGIIFSIVIWVPLWFGIGFTPVGNFLRTTPATITGPVLGGFGFLIFCAVIGLIVGCVVYKCCE